MQRNCVRCERKVKAEDNWLQAHLWASNAVFHWSCFIALMKEHGEQGANRRHGRAAGGPTEIQENKP
jgi:hypothetical protein